MGAIEPPSATTKKMAQITRKLHKNNQKRDHQVRFRARNTQNAFAAGALPSWTPLGELTALSGRGCGVELPFVKVWLLVCSWPLFDNFRR